MSDDTEYVLGAELEKCGPKWENSAIHSATDGKVQEAGRMEDLLLEGAVKRLSKGPCTLLPELTGPLLMAVAASRNPLSSLTPFSGFQGQYKDFSDLRTCT